MAGSVALAFLKLWILWGIATNARPALTRHQSDGSTPHLLDNDRESSGSRGQLPVAFRAAKLNRTNLSGTKLDGAILDQAWLLDADLSNASLKGANIFAAQMQRAKLDGAELSGARVASDLTGASLAGASRRSP